MAFVAALQKLFRDYETLLNAYKPLGTPPSIKNATEKTLDETLVSVTEETKKAAEVELQPAKAAAEVELPPAEEAAEIQLPPADAAAEIQQLPADAAAVVKESAAEIQPPATVVKGEVNAAAEIQPPADAAAVVKEAVKAATVVKQLQTKTATVVELQQSADIISIKNAINNMKSSFPNKPLREPLVNTNLNYGAPLNLKVKSPVQINHSRLMEEIELIHANKLMEERKLKKKNQKKATALWKFHKSYSYNDKLKKYEHNGKYERKEPTKYMKDLEKEKELKKYSESDFETKEYLTNQKIEKAIGIKSCCSNSGMFGQLYDGIPIEICEKKEKLKTYPDSFFNCFVDFFNCIGFSISEKKLRTLVSKAIEKYSFSEEELNELYMEVKVNVDLLGKLMKLEQERMHKLLNGPDLLKYKLSNAITEDFVQVGSAIYPFMNKVLENLKRKDFSKKTLLVRDFDDAEILSDSDRNWLGNSTNKDFSFTIDGKMYRNLEFVVIVGYKQSNYGTIRYVLENNMSSESNDRLVLIQSDGFLYDLGYVKIDGEQVFIMDKTKIFAKTSEKLIKEETLVRKEKEKQLEVVNEKIELLDNNKQENINEIKNINNQNILLNTAISNNYNRNYYKETKNCDTLTIVGFMVKILKSVIQEIEETATDDDTIDSLEIKFLTIMNEKISKKRSAKYDCRIENINDEYILITKDTGINTPRVRKHKTSLPTNLQPLSPTTNLVFNGFETKVLAKIKDFWRRNTQSLDKNIIENKKRIINLENSITDIINEKNKLIKDKGVIEKELSVLKKSLEEKIDQLQETKSSPAVNTVTLVPQLPEKEKVADVPMSVELKKQFEFEKELGVQKDLSNVTKFAQPHVYIPGSYIPQSQPPPPPPPPQGKGVYIPPPPPPPPPQGKGVYIPSPPPPTTSNYNTNKPTLRPTLSFNLKEAIEKNIDVKRNVPFDLRTSYKPVIKSNSMLEKVKKENKNSKKKQKEKINASDTWEDPISNEGEAMAPKSFSTTQPLPPKKNNNIFLSSPEEIAAFSAARKQVSPIEIAEQKRLESMKIQEALASIRKDMDTDTDKEDDVWDCAYQRFGGGRTNRALSRGTF